MVIETRSVDSSGCNWELYGPSKSVSDGSGAGSGSDCDGWVFDDDGGYDLDEAYELFQWAVE